MFLEGNFTGKENLFPAVNIKNGGRRNVTKHKEIKGSDKYFTLDISSKFDSLDKMKNHIFRVKRKIGNIRKGVDYLTGFKAKIRPQRYKKARYAIANVSKKDLYKIIKEFDCFEKLPYEKKRPKHEPTDSYFYLSIYLVKCTMSSNNLNWHDHSGYTETTALSLNVISVETTVNLTASPVPRLINLKLVSSYVQFDFTNS